MHHGAGPGGNMEQLAKLELLAVSGLEERKEQFNNGAGFLENREPQWHQNPPRNRVPPKKPEESLSQIDYNRVCDFMPT